MLPKCCRVHARDHHPRFLPCDRSLLSLSFISAADAAADRPYPLSVSQGPALFPSSFFPFSHPPPSGEMHTAHTHTYGVRASETRANAVSPHRASGGKDSQIAREAFRRRFGPVGEERAQQIGPKGCCRGAGRKAVLSRSWLEGDQEIETVQDTIVRSACTDRGQTCLLHYHCCFYKKEKSSIS